VFVAIYAVRGEGRPKLPTLALVTSAGEEPVLLPAPAGAAALSGLNGVVAVRGVGVYASDTGSQRIVLWREDPSGVFSAQVVADDVPMPNGLAYAPRTRTLYVASRAAEKSSIAGRTSALQSVNRRDGMPQRRLPGRLPRI
jgi:sugar lactone lactonase YvrE